jgi:hypothetical protein
MVAMGHELMACQATALNESRPRGMLAACIATAAAAAAAASSSSLLLVISFRDPR